MHFYSGLLMYFCSGVDIRFEVCCCFAGRPLSSSRIRSMIPTNGSSFGRAGGRLRRYPGGTENASIFATVRGSIPNRRAASRRLIPSTYTARRTCTYSSTPFIPPPSAHLGRRPSTAGFLLRRRRTIRPLFEGLSLRRSHDDHSLTGLRGEHAIKALTDRWFEK